MKRYKHNRLQQLRGFCHAARLGSISRAADSMLLSQPSVSLQIKALESELGAKLFERRGPQIELTADGRTLLDLARPLVEAMDHLEDAFAARRASPDHGTVTIAAGGSTIQYILPRYVERFIHKHPRVDLRFCNVMGKEGLRLLREGAVDFAVGPLLEAASDIEFRPVVTCEPLLITSRDHPLARRKRLSLRDISSHPLILPPADQTTCRIVAAVFQAHSLDYDVSLEVGGYEVIKEYVRLNLGISIVMSHCLTANDRLHSRSVKRYFDVRSYGVLLRKNRPLQPAASRFVETLSPAT